jgi:hypothetical protein
MGTNGLLQGDTEIESHLKANNTYGRNGALNPSSDIKIGTTSTNFLPKLEAKTPVNSQTREVTGSIAAAHGMRNRNAESKNTIPGNDRPVVKR